jgi:hypothetical protein
MQLLRRDGFLFGVVQKYMWLAESLSEMCAASVRGEARCIITCRHDAGITISMISHSLSYNLR